MGRCNKKKIIKKYLDNSYVYDRTTQTNNEKKNNVHMEFVLRPTGIVKICDCCMLCSIVSVLFFLSFEIPIKNYKIITFSHTIREKKIE